MKRLTIGKLEGPSKSTHPESGLCERIRQRFAQFGDVQLVILPRNHPPDPESAGTHRLPRSSPPDPTKMSLDIAR